MAMSPNQFNDFYQGEPALGHYFKDQSQGIAPITAKKNEVLEIPHLIPDKITRAAHRYIKSLRANNISEEKVRAKVKKKFNIAILQ